MGDVTTVGLGFQGAAANRFESAILGQAPGSAAFFACVLVHVRESLLVAPTQCAYFGNFNNVNAGWELGRTFDVPASDPPNSPEIVTFRVRLGAGGVVEELTYSMDASTIFGRTHMLAVSVIGLVATLYLNGTAVAALTLGAPLALGASRLTYGNRSGGGLRSGDPIIAAAYSDTDAADFILNQRLLFDRIRGGGNLASSIPALGLEAAYIYEGFSQKAPNSGIPTLPLTNFGVAGILGNLTFAGTTALNVNIDLDPDYTGGAQSTTGGAGGLNLQDAYNAGPTGLIVTGAPGPFGVDDIRIEDNVISTPDGDPVAELIIQAGDNTGAGIGAGEVTISGGNALNGDSGRVTIRSPNANSDGVNGFSGGQLALSGGNGGVAAGAGTGGTGSLIGLTAGNGGTATGAAATSGPGGSISILAGAGGNTVAGAAPGDGGNGFIAAGAGANATGTDTGGTGGQLILNTGAGGSGTGAGATAGNGGELNIGAGPAGTIAGGATPGVGGALILSAGTSSDGLGGSTQLSSGNGVQSGDLTVLVGSSDGIPGVLRIRGGTAQGLASLGGGSIEIIGGPAAVGTGQNGGSVIVIGGAGDGAAGTGGRVDIAGGGTGGGGGPGGETTLRGGIGGTGGIDTGGAGGGVIVQGGSASQPNQPGGDAQLLGGSASGAAALGGNVLVQSGGVAGAAAGSGDVVINSGLGTGVGSTAGSVEVALNAGSGNAAAVVGGFFLDPANGRLSLRNFTPAATPTGSLKLHELDTAGEALQLPAQQALLHFQTEQSAGIATTVGFRASKSGDYGLVARVYQRTIDASGTYVVVHNLDCNAPVVAVYNAAGLAVVPTSITQNTLDQITVVAVVAGGGFLTVVGI